MILGDNSLGMGRDYQETILRRFLGSVTCLATEEVASDAPVGANE